MTIGHGPGFKLQHMRGCDIARERTKRYVVVTLNDLDTCDVTGGGQRDAIA